MKRNLSFVAVHIALAGLMGCGEESSDEPVDATASTTDAMATTTANLTTGAPVENMNESPTFEATIDAAELCAGVARHEFIATRIACIGDGPCTLPQPPTAIVGTVTQCPSTDALAVVRVPVTLTGEYHVELRSVLSDDSEQLQCFRRGGTEDDTLRIRDSDVEDRPTIRVNATGEGCSSQ